MKEWFRLFYQFLFQCTKLTELWLNYPSFYFIPVAHHSSQQWMTSPNGKWKNMFRHMLASLQHFIIHLLLSFLKLPSVDFQDTIFPATDNGFSQGMPALIILKQWTSRDSELTYTLFKLTYFERQCGKMDGALRYAFEVLNSSPGSGINKLCVFGTH